MKRLGDANAESFGEEHIFVCKVDGSPSHCQICQLSALPQTALWKLSCVFPRMHPSTALKTEPDRMKCADVCNRESKR